MIVPIAGYVRILTASGHATLYAGGLGSKEVWEGTIHMDDFRTACVAMAENRRVVVEYHGPEHWRLSLEG